MVRSVLCLLTVALAFVPLLSAVKEKPGVCPKPNTDIRSSSGLTECNSDSQCGKNLKCCFDCGHVCKGPQRGGSKAKRGFKPSPGDFGVCVHPCRSDEDCKDDKCCPTKCGKICQPAVIEPKPGSCPAPVPHFAPCPDECSDDSHCKKNLKCCYSGCGLQCLPPEDGKSQKG
ncbi:hypothetical protein NQD34_005586 [Periophthalmus magnuspinnatus]|nr:hypothetical protein NQD34_005586 [Periophthalmus magnuspinnatus]